MSRFERLCSAMPKIAEQVVLFPSGIQRAVYDDLLLELEFGEPARLAALRATVTIAVAELGAASAGLAELKAADQARVPEITARIAALVDNVRHALDDSVTNG